jgi:isopenicillin-N N-acyltransferase-like protein
LPNAIPVIDLRGSPRAVGRGHGETLRAQIAHALGIYSLAIARGEDELRAVGGSVAARVRAFSPELAEEIEGIAEGAGVEPHRIYVLNARSELMAGAPDGCTAVFAPRPGLLGQNWDWLALLEPLVAVLRIERGDGMRLATLTEPGMVGKIGCSSAGLGVCLNFVYDSGPLDGVPVHVVLRDLLHQPDLAAARARVEAAGGGRAANVLVGSARDGGFDVTWLGRRRVLTPICDAPFSHTNHVGDDPSTGGPFWENSRARLARARALEGGVGSLEDLLALLSDRDEDKHPISRAYAPLDLVPGVQVGTVATVAMELAEARLHVRKGPDPATPLQMIETGASH